MFTLGEARTTHQHRVDCPDCGGALVIDRYINEDGDLLVVGGCTTCERPWVLVDDQY